MILNVRDFGMRFLSGVLAVVMVASLLCTAASAAVQSSAYLDSYSATVTPKSGGKLVVSVDVSGVGRMTEIGAKTIYIYESSDGENFTRVATYTSTKYPEMMGTGTNYFKDAITHQGTAGKYYYASVWVYAADKTGSDEKNYSTAVKKAIP